jgi:hypothetical protein
MTQLILFKGATMTKALMWLVKIGIGLVPVIAQARSSGATGARGIPAKAAQRYLGIQPWGQRGKG